MRAAAIDDATSSNWLNSLEVDSEFIFYVADHTLTDWTRKCLRQADALLLVAVDGAQSLRTVRVFRPSGQLERQVGRLGTSQDLVHIDRDAAEAVGLVSNRKRGVAEHRSRQGASSNGVPSDVPSAVAAQRIERPRSYLRAVAIGRLCLSVIHREQRGVMR